MGLVLVSTVAALLFGELFVRMMVNPEDFLPATLIGDPALGHRIKPHTTGHDALGFRNAVVPDQVNIVAIGDSMTYGFGVTRDGSWPYQLGILLSEPVYSMALGGYGPLQYLHLAQHEAKKLRPKLLLVGFNFGNDLIDAFSASYQNPYWYSWRKAGSVDGSELEYQRSVEAEPKKRFAAVRDWLYKHSVFYSMLRVTVLAGLASWEQERMAMQVTPDRQMVWVDPFEHSVRTIFSPQLRLSALDPQLQRVKEGLRITKQAFSSMMNQADAQGMQILVVLIPTKERVYCTYLKSSSDRVPNTFARLCEAEERVKEDLIQFLATEKIAYVDVTGAMEATIRKHVQIFPKETDSHPQANGHNVIARSVYDAVPYQLRIK